MAMPSNTFATYEAVGNREDLSDEIFRIDPTDTPFFTMCEKVKASAVNHEWQTQALDNRDTGNAVLEGDDATTDATVPIVRLGNICQISDKVARVSGTQQAVEHAGRGDELGYQKMLKGLALEARHRCHPLRHQPGQGGRRRFHRAQDRFVALLARRPTPRRAPAPRRIRLRRTAPAPAPTARRWRSPRRG